MTLTRSFGTWILRVFAEKHRDFAVIDIGEWFHLRCNIPVWPNGGFPER